MASSDKKIISEYADYKIIYSDLSIKVKDLMNKWIRVSNIENFENDIKSYLSKGYKLIGHPVVNEHIIYQALYLPNPEYNDKSFKL